jgi:hypothetical protein
MTPARQSGSGATQRYGVTALHDMLVNPVGRSGGASRRMPAIAHGYVTMATGTLTATDVDPMRCRPGRDANGVLGRSRSMPHRPWTIRWTTRGRPRRRWRRAMRRPNLVATVTDEHGATDTVNVDTITGSGAGDYHGGSTGERGAVCGGGLDHVVTADVAGDHKFDRPEHRRPGTLLAATLSDMHCTVSRQAALGHAAAWRRARWGLRRRSLLLRHHDQRGGRPARDRIRRLRSKRQRVVNRHREVYAGWRRRRTAPDRSRCTTILAQLDAASIDDKFLPAAGRLEPNPTSCCDALIAEINAANLGGRSLRRL